MSRVFRIPFLVALVLAAAAGCPSNGTSSTTGAPPPPCNPACGANATCNLNPDGTGTCACYQNYVTCPGSDGGAVCANLKLDDDECGGCGTICPTGESCLGGVCTCHLTTCIGDAGTSTCTDPESDPLNCGNCGNICPEGEECLLGMCTCEETSTVAECTTDAGLSCVDTARDSNNCGGCGTVCAGNQECDAPAGAGGVCRCRRDAGPGAPLLPIELCNESCVDTTQDPFNCGGCGNVCVSGSCILGDAGSGVCNCPLPYTICEPDCVDTYSDINHCGSCDTDCTIIGAGITELTCNLGHCYCGPTGQGVICPDGTCSTLGNDPNNCGICGNVCLAPAQDCINGTCSCPDSQSLCGGDDSGVPQFCIDTTQDPDNCGTCNNVCTQTYATGVYSGCRFGLCTCDPTQAHLCATSVPGGLPTCACPANAVNCATLSFASDVYPLLAQQSGSFGCSASGCHSGAKPAAGLAFLDSSNNLDAGMAYAELVLVPPASTGQGGPAIPFCDGGVPGDSPSTECSCVSRVVPGNHNASYLTDILLNDIPGQCASTLAMPIDDAGGWTPLSSCSQQFMQQWIDTGANP